MINPIIYYCYTAHHKFLNRIIITISSVNIAFTENNSLLNR